MRVYMCFKGVGIVFLMLFVFRELTLHLHQ